jgi:hypothetical protein
MSTIKSSTTTTTAYQVVADTTGALVIQTGATPTTAMTINTSQNTSFAGTVADLTGTLRPLVSSTAVASTSGTSIDFTGIPSWVKRVTVLCSGISKSSTANFLFQIGDSGGVETTSYTSGTFSAASGASLFVSPTNGFQTLGDAAGSVVVYGSIVFTNITGNTWIASGLLFGNSYNTQIAGEKTLSATLDRIRVTTTSGTDTFDAGTINILYEG